MYIRSIFLLALMSISCSKDFDIKTEQPDQLFATGLLFGANHLEINLSPIITFDEHQSHQPAPIDDALVIVYEDKLFPIDTLHHSHMGVYVLSNEIDFKEGRNYHFTVETLDFPKVISNSFQFIPQSDLQSISFSTYSDGYRFSGEIPATEEESFYFFNFLFERPNGELVSGLTTNLSLSVDDGFNSACGWTNSIITNFCFLDQKIPLDFYVRSQNINTPVNCILNIYRINRELFNYLSKNPIPESEIESLFLGIVIPDNKFENGRGVVYTINSSIYKFEL